MSDHPTDCCECLVKIHDCWRIAYYDGSVFWIPKHHETKPEKAFGKDYLEVEPRYIYKAEWRPINGKDL
jgi:hypothetical protein